MSMLICGSYSYFLKLENLLLAEAFFRTETLMQIHVHVVLMYVDFTTLKAYTVVPSHHLNRIEIFLYCKLYKQYSSFVLLDCTIHQTQFARFHVGQEKDVNIQSLLHCFAFSDECLTLACVRFSSINKDALLFLLSTHRQVMSVFDGPPKMNNVDYVSCMLSDLVPLHFKYTVDITRIFSRFRKMNRSTYAVVL